MKPRYGVSPCDGNFRVTILDEAGHPQQFVEGLEFIHAESAQRAADALTRRG